MKTKCSIAEVIPAGDIQDHTNSHLFLEVQEVPDVPEEIFGGDKTLKSEFIYLFVFLKKTFAKNC